MKKSLSPSPTRRKAAPIPRLVSLLHRLERAKDDTGQPQPWLDELMRFLEDPPSNIRDRWKHGAEMCRAWGIETSGTAVWRLYRSHVIEWRLKLADQLDVPPELATQAEEKARRLTSLRVLEALADPGLTPIQLTSLARLELRRQAIALAREKHRLVLRNKRENLIDGVLEDLKSYPQANEAFEAFKQILNHVPGWDDDHHLAPPPDPLDSPTIPLIPPHSPDSPDSLENFPKAA